MKQSAFSHVRTSLPNVFVFLTKMYASLRRLSERNCAGSAALFVKCSVSSLSFLKKNTAALIFSFFSSVSHISSEVTWPSREDGPPVGTCEHFLFRVTCVREHNPPSRFRDSGTLLCGLLRYQAGNLVETTEAIR